MDQVIRAMDIATASVVTARPDESVGKAARVMMRGWFRRLPVVESGRVLGILTARNLVSGLVKTCSPRCDAERYSSFLESPLRGVMGRPPPSVDPDSDLWTVARLMAEDESGALLVVRGDRLAGIISERDVVRHYPKGEVRLTVGEVMTEKVRTLPPDAPIISAFREMASGGFRRTPIVDGGELVGIVTAMDLMRFMVEEGTAADPAAALSAPVRTIMTSPVITVSPLIGVAAAAELMARENVGCLPVTKRRRVVGIITERDLLLSLVREGPGQG